MKTRLAIIGFALLLTAAPAVAQGCAMCAKSADASGARGRRAMGKAVAVLLVPTVGFLVGAVVLARRYRN